MSTAKTEILLARLYSDEEFLARFLDAPQDVLAAEGFSDQERAKLAAAIDASELIVTAKSYTHQRERRKQTERTE